MISIRTYQENAIARVLELFMSGVRRVLLVLATGGGKTVIASELVRRVLEQRFAVIFLAHRRELIKQTYAKLVRNGLPATEIGVIMAGVEWRVDRELISVDPSELDDEQLWRRWARRRPIAPIQVGSIDTFRNRAKPFLDAERLLLIVDEAHRGLAKSYRDAQEAYPNAWHLGLTATPIRADGKPLSDAYDEIVVAASFDSLVAEGFLVPPTCYGTPLNADLSDVRRSGNDYNAEDLARAVDRGELVGGIVDNWIKRGNNAPTFAFAANVEHSKHIAERFNEAGIPARHVDGMTENGERDDAIASLKDGRIKVLSNCGVFTEGTDVPCVKTIILARPTLSEGLYLQMAGRGARPYNDQPFVILDHAKCCSNPLLGGLPQQPREWTLEGRPKRQKDGPQLPPAKDCPQCLAIVARNTRTCECGYDFGETPEPTAPKPLEEKEGELVELSPLQLDHLKEWNESVAAWEWRNFERRSRGETLLKGGVCCYEWKQAHNGQWAPLGAKVPKLTSEEVAYNESLKRRYAREKSKRARDIERTMTM